MRTKHQILDDSQRVMDQLPKEGRLLVHHEVLFLEVWIDIRDVLNDRLPEKIKGLDLSALRE